MDANEYQKNALKTESPITEDLSDRYGRSFDVAYDLIRELVFIGRRADILKRWIYYGDDACKIPERVLTESRQIHYEKEVRLFHALVGKLTELGELAETFQNFMIDGELDGVNLKEELGDDSWYTAIAADVV